MRTSQIQRRIIERHVLQFRINLNIKCCLYLYSIYARMNYENAFPKAWTILKVIFSIDFEELLTFVIDCKTMIITIKC